MTGISWKTPQHHAREKLTILAIMLRNVGMESRIIDLWISGQPADRLFDYVARQLELAADGQP